MPFTNNSKQPWLALTLGVLLLTTGCTSTYYIEKDVNQPKPIVITEGMSTDQLIEKLGNPKVKEAQPGSAFNWYYHFQKTKKLYIIRVFQGTVQSVEERFQESK